MDAYVFATDATSGAVTDALALVSGGTARAVLPISTARELYIALADSSGTGLMNKISTAVTITGLTTPVSYLAMGASSQNAPFPTYGVVDDHVGFALLTTSTTSTVSVYEAALQVSGVVGAAIVSGGTVNVIVEATSDSTTTLASTLSTVSGLTGVTSSVTSSGPVSGGAGFTTS